MLPPLTDRDLLTAYLAGSEDAFRALVERHIGLVYAKALRQAPPAHALAGKIAALALSQSTTATTASLLAKGAAKLMTHTLAKIALTTTLSAVVLTAGATILLPRPAPAPTAPDFIAAPASAPAPFGPIVRATPSIRVLPNDPIPTIDVTDLVTHTPIPGVTIDIYAGSINIPVVQTPPATALTGPDGTVQLPLPPTTSNALRVVASKAGYVPAKYLWHRNFPTDHAPARFSFTLEKAITIGGRVVGPQDTPLSNATVLLYVRKSYTNGSAAHDLQTATTDVNGNWSLDTIPEAADFIAIGVSHVSSLDNFGSITYPAPFPKYQFDAALFAQLKNRSHVLRIDPGLPLSVTVHGPDGKPLKAAITIGTMSTTVNSMPDVETDDHGHVLLGLRKADPFYLSAHAPGFASAVVVLPGDQKSDSLEITLAPPTPLRAHIVDPSGAPIANATLCVDYWINDHAYIRDFPITRISNQNGDITWTEAPDKKMTVLVAAPGCMSKELALSPGSNATITLLPQPFVRVHAISPSTGKPLTDFHAVEGVADSEGKNVQWLNEPHDLARMHTFPDGSFEFTDQFERPAIIARAVGAHYRPSDSPILHLDGHDYDVTLPLEEAPPLTGQAVDADSKPLPHLIVSLYTRWYDIYAVPIAHSPDQVKNDPAHFATTDNAGNFSFPPQPEPCLLVASSDTGYALLLKPESDSDITLPFHPWASIHGTLLQHGAPAPAGIGVRLDGFFDQDLTFGPGVHLSTTTDAAGHFTFPASSPANTPAKPALPRPKPRCRRSASGPAPARRAPSRSTRRDSGVQVCEATAHSNPAIDRPTPLLSAAKNP